MLESTLLIGEMTAVGTIVELAVTAAVLIVLNVLVVVVALVMLADSVVVINIDGMLVTVVTVVFAAVPLLAGAGTASLLTLFLDEPASVSSRSSSEST